MTYEPELTGAEAGEQAKKRESAEHEARQRCSCRRTIRIRRYLGVWLCGFCNRLRYA